MTRILGNHGSPPDHSEWQRRLVRTDMPAKFPLFQELVPAPDPVDCFGRLAGLPHLLYLDSAAKTGHLGRYSYLTAGPFRFFEVHGNSFAIDGRGQAIATGVTPLDLLAREMAPFMATPVAELPPFQGGAAGVFGYELSRYFERLPLAPPDDIRLPDLSVGLYDWLISWDHEFGRAWIVSTGFPELDPARRGRRAADQIAMVLRRLNELAPRRARQPYDNSIFERHGWPVPGRAGLYSNFDPVKYGQVVRRAIEYIHAGDCFQVNVAQRLFAPFTGDPIELYLQLRERNAAPFAGFFDQGNFILASASPERFLQVDRGLVRTRPIKGTRPRLADPVLDLQQKTALATSQKDRAENVMIVDLLRNDLGRVCAFGSIQVPSLCQVESFAYVHHLVSEVQGRLRPGRTPLDLIRASFPGGSITGAPKIRAMEIICELEACARGWYCGSLGFLGFDGSMDTNLLIRSFVIYPGGVQFSVGGGIVADSDPGREYEETWHKAEGMLRALPLST